MEKIKHHKKSIMGRLSLAVGALTLACLMQGCQRLGGSSAETQSPTEDSAATSAVTSAVSTEITSPETEADPSAATDALRSYYESLVAALRQELLEEREDRYISDTESKLRLEELEATIAALEEAINQDTPTGGEPITPPSETEADTLPAETQPPEVETEAPVDFTYRIVEGQAHVTGYTGKDTTVYVPTQLNGYTVVAIDDSAFQNTSVKAVILPGSVTTVGWFDFSGCFELELVTLPASVSKIHYGAFDSCPSLTLLCPADSYAEAYAISFGLTYRYV